MRKFTLASILLVIGMLIVIAFLVFFYVSERGAMKTINSIADCAESGYPVAESYPRQCRTPDGRLFVEEVSDDIAVPPIEPEVVVGEPVASSTPSHNSITAIPASAASLVRTVNIPPGGTIMSPLTVTGEARGFWFFEASFPIELEDANGVKIATGIAIAQGEWMTEEFVPFAASFSFTKPATKTGTLILRKDNASGLPEHDAAIFITVTFAE
jgi:hypothetical protein